MPLIDRRDTILFVIDVQPRFIAHDPMTSEEQAEAQAAFERALWLAGMATLLDIPSVVVEEGPHRAGATEARLMERLPPQTVVHQRKTFGLMAQPEIVAAIKAGELTTYCALPSRANRFRELLITPERTPRPRNPARPVLVGAFTLP